MQGTVLSNEKRYSDFVTLRETLEKSFTFHAALPELPQKKLIGTLVCDIVI